MLRKLALAILVLASASCAAQVRIGVLGLFHPQELHVRSGGSSWAVVSGCGHTLVLEPRTERSEVVLRRTARGVRATAASGWTMTCDSIRVASRKGETVPFELHVPGKLRRVYEGVAEIHRSGNELTATVSMNLESAVASVVAAEASQQAPIEALKAQAVAARSFFSAARGAHKQFDFCDTTHCQFLRGRPPQNSAAARATKATGGLVLSYHSEVLAAMYSASCGGRTRTLRDVGIESRGYPYFAVDCSYCREHATRWRRDSEAIPRNERERLAIGRRQGWSAIPGNNFRLLAAHVVDGAGAGHGVGLCQAGAAAMAAAGKDFRAILAYYYPNTQLASTASGAEAPSATLP